MSCYAWLHDQPKFELVFPDADPNKHPESGDEVDMNNAGSHKGNSKRKIATKPHPSGCDEGKTAKATSRIVEDLTEKVNSVMAEYATNERNIGAMDNEWRTFIDEKIWTMCDMSRQLVKHQVMIPAILVLNMLIVRQCPP